MALSEKDTINRARRMFGDGTAISTGCCLTCLEGSEKDHHREGLASKVKGGGRGVAVLVLWMFE